MEFGAISKAIVLAITLIFLVAFVAGCADDVVNESDKKQSTQQEKLLIEAVKQCGMPNIINFREKKILKEIYELRDQTGLLTYSYLLNEFTGKFIYLGETIGYPIPYATQYTSPEKAAGYYEHGEYSLPQADPNGLFSPASAAGTWILILDHKSKEARPAYIEPNVVCMQSKFPDSMVQNTQQNNNP
jgi:hypothetical protein